VDHHSGKLLARRAEYNSQISYGEDVISRIIQAEKPKGQQLMQELIVNTINGLISRLLLKTDVQRDEITSITLAGNTTMTHLLLGLEPHNIRRAPYVPISTFFPPIRARDIGLELPLRAVALVYPAISSYPCMWISAPMQRLLSAIRTGWSALPVLRGRPLKVAASHTACGLLPGPSRISVSTLTPLNR
jgi:hypothetical protein